MKPIFQSLQLRDLALNNRIAVSPMQQYSSEDGFANDWHMVHLGSRTLGGAGLIISGCAAIPVSGGGFVQVDKSLVSPGYQVPFASKIKKESGTKSERLV